MRIIFPVRRYTIPIVSRCSLYPQETEIATATTLTNPETAMRLELSQYIM